MLLYLLLLVIGLALLIKSADIFTERAERIGLALGMPPFIVGILIVGLGTSFPELATSLAAVIAGKTDVVIGNVLGSNITNILLVLGIAAIFAKNIKMRWDVMRVDLPLMVGSTIFILICLIDATITTLEALLALAGYGIYLWYTMSKHTRVFIEEERERSRIADWALLLVSGAGIYAGARLTMGGLTNLSEALHLSTGFLAISLVALGTSLPEVIVTIRAAQKKKAELAVGNVLGSNIFNGFVVLGIPGLIAPLTIGPGLLGIGLLFLAGATLLFTFITQDREITFWDGLILLLLFALFVSKIAHYASATSAVL